MESSRYDLDVALTVAIVALFVGVRHLRARYDYDLEDWAEHFESEAQALQWRTSRIRIGILSTYNMPMCALIRTAVKFIYSLEPGVLGMFLPGTWEQIEIVVTSADATQGETYEVDIKAFTEDIDEWSSWSREPERVLTTFSRAYRQTVMTQVQS